MLGIVKLAYDTYRYCFDELADPRTESFFLMGNSPIRVMLVITIYLIFVKSWGPRFMENRKPFNIDKILIAYNIFQIMCSANLLYRALKHTYGFGGYSFICEPVDKSYSEHALIVVQGAHDYFLLKLVDLLDTVFFVLRKKWSQISYLHLYHHAGMVATTWLGVRFLPGGQSIFIGFLNSAVHIVMYSYYLITSLNKNQPSPWWKKYITQMQLAQFLIIEINLLSALFFPCGYPKIAIYFLLIQNTFLLGLFLDFYYKAYIAKKSKVRT